MRDTGTGGLPHHRACQTLTGLTLDSLPRDGSVGRSSQQARNTPIWTPEDPADRIYFLKRGQVATKALDAHRHEVLLRVIDAGEPFGELCMCAEQGGLRGTTATAVMDCDIVEITSADFLAYLQNDRGAILALLITFCTRLSDAEQRLEVLAQRGAAEPLGTLLLHLARTRGHASGEGAGRVVLAVSHDDLAQMAAMSRPHVTVTMGEFRNRGFVEYGRNQPLVVDVTSLTAYLLTSREPSG